MAAMTAKRKAAIRKWQLAGAKAKKKGGAHAAGAQRLANVKIAMIKAEDMARSYRGAPQRLCVLQD